MTADVDPPVELEGDDLIVVGPSGTRYRLPHGEEVSRIDEFLRRMDLTNMREKLRGDIDALLDVRVMLAPSDG